MYPADASTVKHCGLAGEGTGELDEQAHLERRAAESTLVVWKEWPQLATFCDMRIYFQEAVAPEPYCY